MEQKTLQVSVEKQLYLFMEVYLKMADHLKKEENTKMLRPKEQKL